jgi:glutamate:GABA antiporter
VQNGSESVGVPALRRSLGTLDLVLLNVAVVIGLRWLSTAAQSGPSSLSLWVIACLVFFVPSGLAVQELSSRIPHEGGLYVWTRAAFGDTHGFLAGWAYSLSNLVFFPSLLLFISGVFLHIIGGSWVSLAESPIYNGLVCLGLLWATTFLNILGLKRAKWLQNIGGISNMVVAVLVLGAGAAAWWRFGSATPIVRTNLAPDLGSLPSLSTLAILILAYSGLELGPIFGDEIKGSSRTIQRAIVIAGVVIAVIYVAGTAALLVALPPEQISAISGIPQSMEAIGQRAGIVGFGTIAAVMLTLANVGGLGAWISGAARLPFVMGLGHYLPERLGAIHPKYGSPYIALLVQAALASVILLAAISGSAIREAYLLLIDMTVALNSLVWMYIFASLAILRRRATGESVGVSLIPGGPWACWLLAGVGLLATAFATIVSLVPPAGGANPVLFLFKGVGGCLLLLTAGFVICRRGRKRAFGAQVAVKPAKA